ncbi:hypothetical protein [Marinobacter adhaerens]|uniref:hypothetical protein n=1 Tax=Marinobacter adhaerens TaxID=1033846 RepID=UPI003D28A41B
MADVLDVLQTLKEDPRSTQALMVAFPEWTDRSDAARFLGNMNRTGLIKKRANGYWALTPKGKERLGGASSKSEPVVEPPANEPVGAQTDAKDVIQDSSAQVLDIPTVKDPGAMKPPGPKPEADPNPVPNCESWQALGHLRAKMPEDSSLVIESGQVFIVTAGAKFAIHEPGDLEAILLAARRCEGKAA